METEKIFVFGLDNAGKTCLIQGIRIGRINPDTKPTTSVTVTNLIVKEYDKNTEFKFFDNSGKAAQRKTWGPSMFGASIMIFVLDTADKKRYEEAKQVLLQVLNDNRMMDVPLIFLFHKMDVPDAKTNLAVAKEFFKAAVPANRQVYFLETTMNAQSCSDEAKGDNCMENVKATIIMITRAAREARAR